MYFSVNDITGDNLVPRAFPFFDHPHKEGKSSGNAVARENKKWPRENYTELNADGVYGCENPTAFASYVVQYWY